MSSGVSVHVSCDFVGESNFGPVVKLIMDHPRLREDDILLEVNGENVQKYPHSDLVNVLKRCPKGNQAAFLVLRQAPQNEVWIVSVVCACWFRISKRRRDRGGEEDEEGNFAIQLA